VRNHLKGAVQMLHIEVFTNRYRKPYLPGRSASEEYGFISEFKLGGNMIFTVAILKFFILSLCWSKRLQVNKIRVYGWYSQVY